MPPPQSSPGRPLDRWLALLTAVAVAAAALRVAWISDDALVTFRTVENLVGGDGLRWNVADRTQTATHPLWVLVLACGRLLTGELYFTTIAIGIGCTALAVWLLARRCAPAAPAVAVVGLGALGARAFVEYATCGLENSLVYLLLAAFSVVWFGADAGPPRLRRLGLLAALLALARQDLLLLVLPCVVAAWRGIASGAAVRALLPGGALLLLWYGFAAVYYGTAIPTPGYGKVLAVDVPWPQLFGQGGHYLLDLAVRDPAMALVLAAAVALGFLQRRAPVLAPALGLCLQVLYTLRVGGDFMSGRFFTAAFVFALAVLAHGVRGRPALLLGAALLGAACLPGWPCWLRSAPTVAEARMEHGICSERAFYAGSYGLWSEHRIALQYGAIGRQFAAQPRPWVHFSHIAGVPGYLGGRHVHVVDPFICDPLLVRLPVFDPAHWRIGHFPRRIPEGYLETLATGENRIRHPALARYWDALAIVLRAPVFDGERLRTTWAFWRGDYDGLLAQYIAEEYRRPPLVRENATQLARAVPDGTRWGTGGGIVVREGGLRVDFTAPVRHRHLRLSIDGGGRGEVRLLRGGEVAAAVPITVVSGVVTGCQSVRVEVPAAVVEFDAVELQLQLPAGTEGGVLDVLAVLALVGEE